MKVKAPFRIEHRWEKRKYPWCIVTQHFFYLLELRGRLYEQAWTLPFATAMRNMRKAVT